MSTGAAWMPGFWRWLYVQWQDSSAETVTPTRSSYLVHGRAEAVWANLLCEVPLREGIRLLCASLRAGAGFKGILRR